MEKHDFYKEEIRCGFRVTEKTKRVCDTVFIRRLEKNTWGWRVFVETEAGGRNSTWQITGT